jgi:hypothetical protein
MNLVQSDEIYFHLCREVLAVLHAIGESALTVLRIDSDSSRKRTNYLKGLENW